MSEECPQLHTIMQKHPTNCTCMCDFCIALRDILALKASYRRERAELLKEFRGAVID